MVLFLSALVGCNKPNELAKQFNCKSKLKLPSAAVYDYNKNFTISIPNNWKTELYFNKTDSDIYAADTTKQLTESFILNTSFTMGNLDFGTAFFSKIDSVLSTENMTKTNAFFSDFNNKKSYWYLIKGKKNGFVLTELNGYVYVSEKNYWRCSVAIYGENQINERTCEAIAVLQTVSFSK